MKKRREALSHVGGEVKLDAADAALGATLRRALEVTADRESVLRHVHGFHSYPARMHPDTAATLVAELSAPGATVLDPFCGSGTVLVEARLAGRRALGNDLNPLAIDLAWLKSGGLGPPQVGELVQLCQLAAEHAEGRRAARAGPTRQYGRQDRELFEPHMLLELDGLRHGIEQQASAEPVARAARLVLSSLLTKVSRQPGDTVGHRTQRRLPGGFAIRLLVSRAELLAQQLEAFWALLADPPPPVKVRAGDARELPGVGRGSVDLVVTSPPYPGVYDYYAQHATRLRWLGFEAGEFERRELGARRRLAPLSPPAALKRWRRELEEVLGAMRRVLRPGGRAAILIADSVLGRRASYADEIVRSLAPRADLEVLACASQARPHFHAGTQDAFRGRARREHLVVLAPRGSAPI